MNDSVLEQTTSERDAAHTARTGLADDSPLHPERLAAAVALAIEAETDWPRDLDRGLNSDARAHEPRWNEVLGPTQARGAPNGVVWHRGRELIAWGDPDRVDMTFSVTKSFLALLAGVALGERRIESIDQAVAETVTDGGFDSPQNRDITWRHLLDQTSEWQGTLFDKPDQVDHFRNLEGAGNQRKGELRELQPPGTYWEYNDVRVNRLSLSLLRRFGQPLPEVLAERIMAPIGASTSWRWEPYRNAEVEVDGQPMMSVPGGGHWGGGMFIASRDLARVARLVQQGGVWEGQRLLPEGWVEALRTPCHLNPVYGLLWWLNTDRRYVPTAPESSYYMIGAGSNIVWIDDELELIVVMRWIDRSRLPEVTQAFLDART